jgi:anti-anti-sigma regulatory factor
MAKHFKIITGRSGQGPVRLRLKGDFDGTSAFELVDTLDKFSALYPRLAVDTDGLKTVHTFGIAVFQGRLKSLRRSPIHIVFSGRFKDRFDQ